MPGRAGSPPPSLAGEKVVVIGGGFTAVDGARMSKRLQADEECLYYRRTHTETDITELELKEFIEEFLSNYQNRRNSVVVPVDWTVGS